MINGPFSYLFYCINIAIVSNKVIAVIMPTQSKTAIPESSAVHVAITWAIVLVKIMRMTILSGYFLAIGFMKYTIRDPKRTIKVKIITKILLMRLSKDLKVVEHMQKMNV